MARTTEANVLLIMGSPTTLSESDVTPFIVPANYMVTNYLASYITDNDDLLEMIERYLTAHYVSLAKEKEVKSEGIEGITQVYGGVFGKGLDYTSYGQMAKALDTTGRLYKLDQGKLTSCGITTLTDVGEDRNYPNI
jgi:hypothetical protein